MADSFDGYYKWLGIPPKNQPPNHYRLLGIDVFETDPDVIDQAADRQMAHLQTFKTGQHSAVSQKLLNEVAAARLCLLDAARRSAYDEKLRAILRTAGALAAESRSATSDGGPAAPTAEVYSLAGAVEPKAPPDGQQPAVSPPARRLAAKRPSESARQRPLWRQPLIIAAGAGGLALGLAILGAVELIGGRPYPGHHAEAPIAARVEPEPPAPRAAPSASGREDS